MKCSLLLKEQEGVVYIRRGRLNAAGGFEDNWVFMVFRTHGNTVSFNMFIGISLFIDNLFSYSGLSVETEIIGRKTTVLQFLPIVGHSFSVGSVKQQLMILS